MSQPLGTWKGRAKLLAGLCAATGLLIIIISFFIIGDSVPADEADPTSGDEELLSLGSFGILCGWGILLGAILGYIGGIVKNWVALVVMCGIGWLFGDFMGLVTTIFVGVTVKVLMHIGDSSGRPVPPEPPAPTRQQVWRASTQAPAPPPAPAPGKGESISILGGGGSGKTVFFAMLSYVLGSGKYSDMFIEYNEGLGYLAEIRKSLESGRWPAKTFTGAHERFSATVIEDKLIGKKQHQLVMVDIAGEDFERVFDPNNSQMVVPPQLAHVPSSKAFIWIMDPMRVKDDMWRYYNLVTYLIKLHKLDSNDKLEVPVAVVFSKADEYDSIIGHPAAYARGNLSDLWGMLVRRVKYLHFFKVSAIGAKDMNGDPRLPLSPVGIAEVIEWVLEPTKFDADDVPSETAAAPVMSGPPPAHVQQTHYPPPGHGPSPTAIAHGKNLETYRAAVRQAIKDGAITMDEQEMLNSMQENLCITPDEHKYILRDEMTKKGAP